jgi:molybdopterin biosynthesis enzyme
MLGEKTVIGVPGYPGSAFLVFEEIVSPLYGRPKKSAGTA